MAKRRTWASASGILLVCAILLPGRFAGAQETAKKEIFKARLSPVPIDESMMATVAGAGSLTATLSGRRLTITGTFEGLRSPATTAQIHRGPKGIPGPAILDLTVTRAEKGEVTGSLLLTPDQVSDLRKERLYVQIQSERAPDGNLWGWILP
ncbi:MAG: CHRD domain-containing protein [Candidatus Acidiferrales bacterium]